jgi:hypothetical protein
LQTSQGQGRETRSNIGDLFPAARAKLIDRVIVSTDDEPAIERLAAALEPHGLIAPGTTRPGPVAARVAEKLGLPHPVSSATASASAQPFRQREALALARFGLDLLADSDRIRGLAPDEYAVADFHAANAERQRTWPHSLLTTSTHDTKRSGDVRARITVIAADCAALQPFARTAFAKSAAWPTGMRVSFDGWITATGFFSWAARVIGEIDVRNARICTNISASSPTGRRLENISSDSTNVRIRR